MKKEDLRIVFMGTPEFAVGTLSALVEGGYQVVAVVTQPDKPVGRHGSVLQPSEVKKYALEKGIPVLQPEKMKDPEFVEELRSYKADLQVVVAFRMLRPHQLGRHQRRDGDGRDHFLPRPADRHRAHHPSPRIPHPRRCRRGICLRRTNAHRSRLGFGDHR